MSSKSYSNTYTTTTSESKTQGAQDNAIIAESGATVNVLDEGAIENSFKIADTAFDAMTETTANTLELAGIYSNNERESMEQVLDTMGDGLAQSMALSSYAIAQQGDFVNNALAAAYERPEFTQRELPEIDTSSDLPAYLGYGAAVLGLVFLWQGLR